MMPQTGARLAVLAALGLLIVPATAGRTSTLAGGRGRTWQRVPQGEETWPKISIVAASA